MRKAWSRRLKLVLGLWLGCGAVASMAGEFYELRVIRMESPEKAAIFDATLESEGMQALSEAGIQAGVFKQRDDSSHDRYLLMVHAGSYSIGQEIIGADAADEATGAAWDYLNADPKDPIFTRQEVSLVKAVSTFPRLKDPEGSGSEDRYFELRIYESATEVKGALKVEMFETGGEIELFGQMGLDLVFFGRAVAGDNLPQLTYMVVYENEDAKKAAWKAFTTSPEWGQMKSLPRYKDTVSKVHSHFLTALPYSHIR